MSRWVHLPVSHMEDMQVLKYVDGQKYDAHWDERAAEDGTPVGGGSRRICTVLMYLSDVEYGGETAFPGGFWLDAAVQNRTEFSACAAKGPAALARKGDAIMFWDMKPDGTCWIAGERMGRGKKVGPAQLEPHWWWPGVCGQ